MDNYTAFMIGRYREHLILHNYSNNTVTSYLRTVKEFFDRYESLTPDALHDYRDNLMERCANATVNQRLNAINSYIHYIKSDVEPIQLMRTFRPTYIDNVITQEEFCLLKEKLKENGKNTLYYLVRFMGSTGMRVSEVLEVTVADVYIGHKDIRSKGNKERRVYFPSSLTYEAMFWFSDIGKSSGYVFTNFSGEKMTTSGVRYLLKHYGIKYGIPESHLHPHALRHRFALNFMHNHQDLAMLSDLLGHESIETTRIYLKKTSDEQRELINAIVNW